MRSMGFLGPRTRRAGHVRAVLPRNYGARHRPRQSGGFCTERFSLLGARRGKSASATVMGKHRQFAAVLTLGQRGEQEAADWKLSLE